MNTCACSCVPDRARKMMREKRERLKGSEGVKRQTNTEKTREAQRDEEPEVNMET